jgi:hypothetical protein
VCSGQEKQRSHGEISAFLRQQLEEKGDCSLTLEKNRGIRVFERRLTLTEEMVMKFVGMLVAATLALGVSASAFAASGVANITSAEGKVLVNAGKGFVPVTGPAALKVGDKVMLGKGGFATVAFKDCAVSLDKPTVFTVTKNAPCAKDQLAGLEAGVFVKPVADAYIAPTPFPYWLLALGGGAVVVTTIVVLTNDDPSSP